MINLGTLKEITDLRSVWSHEALNFTPWVAENVDLLADAVGLDITVDETESSVGDFNVDIYASETGTDRKIIIENQLEDTDHDHLGKLITYASGKDADVVIWVVKHAREEHKAAVEWLNNHTDDKIGFFLCEIKLFQIGDSDIAPSFTVVNRPNDWTKEIRRQLLQIQHSSRDWNIGEYYGAAEPPVRCGESHLSGLTEPPHFFIKLLCHCWVQSIYFSHREVFSWVNTFNIDLIGIIRYAIHDGIGKSTFTITDLLVPLTFTELRTKDC